MKNIYVLIDDVITRDFLIRATMAQRDRVSLPVQISREHFETFHFVFLHKLHINISTMSRQGISMYSSSTL